MQQKLSLFLAYANGWLLNVSEYFGILCILLTVWGYEVNGSLLSSKLHLILLNH